MPERLKIGFVGPATMKGLDDVRCQGGTPASIAAYLQAYCGDVLDIGPKVSPPSPLAYRAWARIEKHLFRKRYNWDMCPRYSRGLSRQVDQNLDRVAVDVVVGARWLGKSLAFLNTSLPVVYCGDGSFLGSLAMCAKWYPEVANLASGSLRGILAVQQRVFDRSAATVVSSHWAAHSIVTDHRVPPERVWVLPEGPNLLPGYIPSSKTVAQKRKSTCCRLLFIAGSHGGGNRWVQKGGPIALDALRKLLEWGIDAELVVCGCPPPPDLQHEKVSFVPYLDKSDPKQAEELINLLLGASFLVIPTRAETYGKSFCEANACGVPAIGTDVGGVGEVIRDGENGYRLPLEAAGEDYARVIKDIYLDDRRYGAMVQSSRKAFEQRLNWDLWGQGMAQVLRQVLAPDLAARVGSIDTEETRT